MQGNNLARPWTFRVENIPQGTTAKQLKGFFYTEDQPYINVRSIVPSVDNYDLEGEYTATITFQTPNKWVQLPRVVDDNISVDSDFHGFTPLNHQKETIAADIIAVTGLAAHAYGSWAHSSHYMWLRDYLPRDITNARVLVYGYPSQLQGNMSRSILSDHSNNFIHRLLMMRDSARCMDRPIVFIGHSLGCLIIKKLFTTESGSVSDVDCMHLQALSDINGSIGIYSSRLSVRSIVFLGAPHRGLHTAALETLVKSRPTEDMIRELKSESPTLTELNDKFRHVAKDIDILTCYELKPTRTAIEAPDGRWKREGQPEMMVPLDSARQYYPKEKLVACDADHTQISKLKRGESSIYPSVRWVIKHAVLSAAEEQATAELSKLQIPFETGYQSPDALHHMYNKAQQLRKEGRTHEAEEAYTKFLKASGLHSSVQPRSQYSGTPVNRPQPKNGTDMEEHRKVQMSDNQASGTFRTLESSTRPSDSKVSQWQRDVRSPSTDNDDQSNTNRSMSLGTEPAPTVFSEKPNALRMSPSEESVTSADPDSEKPALPHPQALIDEIALADNGQHPLLTSSIEAHNGPSLQSDNLRNTRSKSQARLNFKLEHSSPSAVDNNSKLSNVEVASHRPGNSTPAQQGDSGRPDSNLQEGAAKTQRSALVPAVTKSEDVSLRANMSSAVKQGDVERVQKLLALGASVHPPMLDSVEDDPFLLAVWWQQEEILKILFDHGADSYRCTECHHTSLHLISAPESQRGSKEPVHDSLITLLLQNRPPLEAKNDHGRTPLIHAAHLGNILVIKRLLNHGADLRALDDWGLTALHAAACIDKLEIVKLLITTGADVTTPSAKLEYCRTPLHYIARNQQGSAETVRVLLDAGARPEARETSLRQPLHWAAENGNVNAIHELVAGGADVNATAADHWRPLHFAKATGKPFAIEALLQHGADPLRSAGTTAVLNAGFNFGLSRGRASRVSPHPGVSDEANKQCEKLLKDAEKTEEEKNKAERKKKKKW